MGIAEILAENQRLREALAERDSRLAEKDAELAAERAKRTILESQNEVLAKELEKIRARRNVSTHRGLRTGSGDRVRRVRTRLPRLPNASSAESARAPTSTNGPGDVGTRRTDRHAGPGPAASSSRSA